MNKLESMQAFVHIVKAGSISQAASEMDVVKSALSRRLKELESYLGAELLHRTTRKLHLTETGSRYFDSCQRILNSISEAERMTAESQADISGRLKLTMPASFARLHMHRLLNNFLLQHTKVTMELHVSDQQINLLDQGFDLAIRIANLADSSLMARRIALARTVICASPNYLKQHGYPQSPLALQQHKGLIYSEVSKGSEHWRLTDPHGQTHFVQFAQQLKANSGDFLLDAAVAGLGIAQLPTFMTYKQIQSGQLQVVLPDYESLTLGIYAVYPPTRYLPRRTKALINYLVEQFKGVPHWSNS